MATYQAVERDMNAQQCLLVDHCFEEGQYESGIDTLEQLRTNSVRPSPSHIRQLIYISLCRPPPASQAALAKGKGKANADNSPFGSPSKLQKKGANTSFRPSAKASEAARTVLSSYAMTILPESLIRAIPCYSLTKSERANLPRPIDLSTRSGIVEEDSVIAQKSVAILDCENCWRLLKPGFISAGNASGWTLTATGKVAEDSYAEENSEELESDVVGDTAWPLLTWLIDLFEKDESLVADKSRGCYSGLLFSQIKPTDGSLERFNVESPLNVMVACYKQADSRRHFLGRRLLCLLVNLTSCLMFSALPLLNSLSDELSLLTTATISKILSDIPATNRGTAFKAAVCDKTLGHDLGAAQQAQPRKARAAQPKSMDGAPGSPSIPAPRSTRRAFSFPVPSMTKLMETLSSFQRHTKASKNDFVILFHLAAAVLHLASEEEIQSNQSDGDRTLILDGSVERAIAETFTAGGHELLDDSDEMSINKMGRVISMKCEVLRRYYAR